MNKNMKKLLALALAALITLGSLGMAAADGVGTPSDLPPVTSEAPAVSEEPIAVPEPAEAPIVTEEPTAALEATEAPIETEEPTAAPEATEAPVVIEEPTAAPEALEAPVVAETVDVTATIVWKDNSNAQGTRPATVNVTVAGSDGSQYYAEVKDRPLDGEDEESFVLHDTWKQTFYSLPKMSGETEIEYSVWVKVPQGYQIDVKGSASYLILKETEANETPAEATEAPEAPEATEAPAETTETPEVTEVPVDNHETIVEAFDIPEVTKAPVLTYEPDPTEEPKTERDVHIAVNADTDMRLEGDGLSEIILTIPAETTVTVLSIEGDWAKVKVNDVIGYIYKDSVDEWDALKPEEPKDSEAADTEMEECPIKATIFSSRRTVMEPGETVYLTSKLEGTEGYEILLQWQCDKGNGFADVPGANDDHYAFDASVETLSYSWRLIVYYR